MTGTARDIDALRNALTGWARHALGVLEIARIVPAQGGASSETYLIHARFASGYRAEWVLRVEPSRHQVYQDPSIARQYSVISTLAAIPELPIPGLIALEPNAAVIGAPFFLMERATGNAPPNDYHREGLLAAAEPSARYAMWCDAVAMLARLHSVDPTAFEFLAFPGHDDGIAQELARWDAYRSWSGVPELRAYDRARDWLERLRPNGRGIGFAWGDARLPNFMFDRDCVSALLDWETASLGGAETDLAWWLFYDRMIGEADGIERLDGLGEAKEFIAFWEDHAGCKAADMEWHMIFAGFRFALISERARALAIGAGRLPADQWGSANPAVRLLEVLLNEHGA